MLGTSSILAGGARRDVFTLAALVAITLSGIAFGQPPATGDTLTVEEMEVRRLHQLLKNHAMGVDQNRQSGPSAEEIALQEMAQRQQRLAQIPYSVDKVHLNGVEGSAAMAQISQRLNNPVIPESRRGSAPICTIKTRLFDTLVGSENRSLKPVGKNHYVATVSLQAGETTFSIKSQSWVVKLPDDAATTDFIMTFYRPPGGTQELHVFAIDDLLATEEFHVPDWLPEEIHGKLKQG